MILARPGGLLAGLERHHPGAFPPQLEPRRRVDGIVHTAVAGDETAQHGAVGRVDDGVHRQGGDVPLPQVEPRPHRAKVVQTGHPFAAQLFLQVGVLHLVKAAVQRLGGPDVQQRAQQPAPFRRAGGHGKGLVFFPLGQQIAEQAVQPFFLGHAGVISFPLPLQGRPRSSCRSAGSAPARSPPACGLQLRSFSLTSMVRCGEALVFSSRWFYNIPVQLFCKVSTFLCRSYQKDTMRLVSSAVEALSHAGSTDFQLCVLHHLLSSGFP